MGWGFLFGSSLTECVVCLLWHLKDTPFIFKFNQTLCGAFIDAWNRPKGYLHRRTSANTFLYYFPKYLNIRVYVLKPLIWIHTSYSSVSFFYNLICSQLWNNWISYNLISYHMPMMWSSFSPVQFSSFRISKHWLALISDDVNAHVFQEHNVTLFQHLYQIPYSILQNLNLSCVFRI